MILVRMCTDAKDWVEAGAALGFPPDKSRNWSRYAFSAKLAIKSDLVLAAQALGPKLAKEPGSATFQCRSQVIGFGSGALQYVESPRCLDQGGTTWCPCAS